MNIDDLRGLKTALHLGDTSHFHGDYGSAVLEAIDELIDIKEEDDERKILIEDHIVGLKELLESLEEKEAAL